jgi:hypothetical protein
MPRRASPCLNTLETPYECFIVLIKKVRPALGGGLAAREPGLGTGRGGDVTGLA